MTGYLISDKEFVVPFDAPIGRRTIMKGVNKDFTPAMAEHWYVKAHGARYVESLEEAHKQLPETLSSVQRARATWEQNQRLAIQAQINAQQERKDLEKLEKEFGVDTKARDKEFEASLEDERKRFEAIQAETDERDADQKAADEAGSLTAAEAERKAAGSEEVANTEMDGPAKEDAEKAASNPPLPTEPVDAKSADKAGNDKPPAPNKK